MRERYYINCAADFFTEGFNDDFQLVVKHLQLVPMEEKISTVKICELVTFFFSQI